MIAKLATIKGSVVLIAVSINYIMDEIFINVQKKTRGKYQRMAFSSFLMLFIVI